MAVNATFRQQAGTTKTLKSSGGDAAITLASLANGSYRQAAKLDLGTPFAQVYDVLADLELASSGLTAGNAIDFWWSPSSNGTAGTDNMGGCSGTDSAYTGYSGGSAATGIKQLIFIGSMIVTAQATTTVQKAYVGSFVPPTRYGSLVMLNGSGAAIHTSDTNCQIRLVPKEFTSE